MEDLFLKLVNMSITASWLVLVVAAVRFLLRRTPKWIVCLLWGLVALRLICPFSIESALSLVPSAEPLPREIFYTAQPKIHSGMTTVGVAADPIEKASAPLANVASTSSVRTLPFVFSRIWILGVGIMLLYMLASFLFLKRRVAAAIPIEKGVKQCEFVDSPFVLGVFRPVIYLPFGMEEGDMAYVLAHEQAHIRRHDHWWKPFGFLLLSVYWFNPVMWTAYVLLCRDIEAACDEKVIRNMETDDRRAYSMALLNCSVHRRRIAACPIAFGEVGVKARIQSVMNYKKPAFWVILTALLVSIVIAVCFMTNPKKPGEVYAITSTLQRSDVQQAQAVTGGEEQVQLLLTEEQTQELVTLLNELKESEFKHGTIQPCEKSVTVSLEKGDFLLLWDGANVELSYSLDEKTVWVISNDRLNTFFDNIERPDWGIHVSVEDATLTQATVVFSQDGRALNGSLSLDWEYQLQIQSNGSWTDVYTRGFPNFTAAETAIPQNGSSEQKIFWEDNYYELAPGRYRIVKYVTLRDAAGTEASYPYYAEFSLAEGSDLNAKMPEGIVCVDLYFQKVSTCLSMEEEYAAILSILEEIKESAQLVPESSISDQVYTSWFNHNIIINYAESRQDIVISQDCTLLWTEDGEKGRQVYSLDGFPQLQEYLVRMTAGVRREIISGSPFASKNDPWNWTKNISGREVDEASIYLRHHSYQEGNTSGTTVSFGTFATERFREMLEILNAIPAESFSERTQENGSVTYSDLRTSLSSRGISVSIIDRVNSLAVVFIYKGSGVMMAICDDLGKVEEESYLGDTTTYWDVNDWTLTQYMQALMENPPIITYLVGSGFAWADPVEYAYEAYSLRLNLIEGWEYQITEYSPNTDNFGIRCRPSGVSDGWLYFSFWPNGYALAEEDRWYGEGSWMGYPSVMSYPGSIATKTTYNTRHAIWSYYSAQTDSGDFVVVNEGADAWFLEYEEAIDDIISLCYFSVEG